MPEQLLLVVVWTIVSFISGSLPFSVWVGSWAAGKDIRQFGDGNPGATNALKAGGWQSGLLALFLDILKGALPVALAHYVFGIESLGLVPIAVAPTAGHAFSPFLGWQGGKALAVSLGTWIGLTYGVVSVIAILLIVFWFAILETDAWSVVLTLVGIVIFVAWYYPATDLVIIALLQSAIVIYKHLPGLGQAPRLRSWLSGILGGSRL